MEENRTNAPELTAQELSELLQIRRDKLTALQSAGHDPFAEITYDQTHHSSEIVAHYDELEGKEVSIAGRMMSKRIMGKASFAHLLDGTGDIQFYVKPSVSTTASK